MLHVRSRHPVNRRHGDGPTRGTSDTTSLWEYWAVYAAVRVARLPLTVIPPTATVPVPRGPLRGGRGVVGARNRACWLTAHEYAKQRVFELGITPGCVLFDTGAHAGHYALLAAGLARPDGQVVAFEPLSRNLANPRKHPRRNGIDTVATIDAAVIESAGETTLQRGAGGSIDGEIYNCKAPRAELLAPGRQFWGGSGTEVVLAGHAGWGAEILPRREGAFAYGLPDRGTRRLPLARGHIEVNVRYCTTAPMGPGSPLPRERRRWRMAPTPRAPLHHCIVPSYVPRPKRISNETRALSPGHLLVVGPGGNRLRACRQLPALRNDGAATPPADVVVEP